MRKQLTMAVVAAVTLGTLVGCSGPNADAVAEAASYSDELTTWTEDLADAGADGAEELGTVLDEAPELKKFEGVDETPTYLVAHDVATRIDTIAAELQAIEPGALGELTDASADGYEVTADLYYDSLVAATDRVTSLTEWIGSDDEEAARAARIDIHLTFAEARKGFLERAAKDFSAMTLDGVLAASVVAFAEDWYLEEVAFQERAIEEIGSWEQLTNGYKDFWGFGDLNNVFVAPGEFAPVLRPAFVQLAEDFALELATVVEAADASAPELPHLGDPYREVLLGGYLPWGDPEATQDHTANRLWALWRIRELEKTPDAAYLTARSTILEELNRGVEEGTAQDFRPGVTRLLDFTLLYSDTFGSLWELVDQKWLLKLEEAYGYGVALRADPMTGPVGEAFDEVLALYEELNEEINALVEADGDPYDLTYDVLDLGEMYREKVIEAASPALEALDDDAQFEQQLADAITATRPEPAVPGLGH